MLKFLAGVIVGVAFGRRVVSAFDQTLTPTVTRKVADVGYRIAEQITFASDRFHYREKNK